MDSRRTSRPCRTSRSLSRSAYPQALTARTVTIDRQTAEDQRPRPWPAGQSQCPVSSPADAAGRPARRPPDRQADQLDTVISLRETGRHSTVSGQGSSGSLVRAPGARLGHVSEPMGSALGCGRERLDLAQEPARARGSRRGTRGGRRRPARSCARSGSCSFGLFQRSAQTRARGSPWRNIAGGSVLDHAETATHGVKEIERRATTGEAARRRLNRYTVDRPPRPPARRARSGASRRKIDFGWPMATDRGGAYCGSARHGSQRGRVSLERRHPRRRRPDTAVEDRWPSRPRPRPRRAARRCRRAGATRAGRDPARTRAVRGQAGHRRPGPDGRADVRRAARARPLPARGRARRGQDARRGDPRQGRRRHASPGSSSPPTWCPPTSSAPGSTGSPARSSTSSSARCSSTSCSPTRSTGRRPRCSRRCSR